MALKSIIYKAELQIADMDRHYYADHALTIARHPSETDERMMIRLAMFAMFASDTLTLTKGLDDVDEPDLWDRDLTGRIERWIDLGQPDERRLARAAGRADQVVAIAYRNAKVWWAGVQNKVQRLGNLTVLSIDEGVAPELARMASRTMRLQVTRQDDQIWIGSTESDPVAVTWQVLKEGGTGARM
ncbi:YaeQ family protein [Chitinasiproducens palmae]|uniref:Uncharacterized conserved protein YaeQ, suppresses RfaH defect n=1 Tax=Chitinasiproducens palmae TaxID=1770053 RepID=A0A1H2PQD9_9BURK|nr:YaeQ family protein [Chitinasiproducens palmae]SDV49045.1 Uncharacterized conserved protein YaeQ, suppresses RfaH defect [Chitinasiproducens palmae]